MLGLIAKSLLQIFSGSIGPENVNKTLSLATGSRMIETKGSGLFDGLAYIAFALAHVSRTERVDKRRNHISSKYSSEEQQFFDFILDHYVTTGVRELDQEKLPPFWSWSTSVSAAVAELCSACEIRDIFVGFQKQLSMLLGS